MTRLIAAVALTLPLTLAACDEAPQNPDAQRVDLTFDNDSERSWIPAAVNDDGELRNPAERFDAIWLQIGDVHVHSADGWQKVADNVGWVPMDRASRAINPRVAAFDIDPGRYDAVKFYVLDGEAVLGDADYPVLVPGGELRGLVVTESFCVTPDDGESRGLEVDWNLEEHLHWASSGLVLEPVVQLDTELTCYFRNPDPDAEPL